MRLRGNNPVLSHSVIVELAQTYKRSPAQIILAWAVRRGVAVIPRSVVREKIVHNADIGFVMEAADLVRLDDLDRKHQAEGELPIEVVFVNTYSEPVALFWRGPTALHPVVDLSPGESFTSNSYDGHSFVVKIDGNTKYAFDVSSSFSIYHLDASSARPHEEL